MRLRKVLGFIPRTAAAPPGPSMRQQLEFNTWRI
jgi:hypothetical protein